MPSFDHDLHVELPSPLGQLGQGVQLGELGGVVGVRGGTGPQAVTEEGDVCTAKISHSSSKWVYRKFSWWCARHQPAMIQPPRETMPVTRLAVRGT